MVEALADGAVKAGLSRSLALTLAVKTMLGTAKLLLDKQEKFHPSQLKDAVASPGKIISIDQLKEKIFISRWYNYLWP